MAMVHLPISQRRPTFPAWNDAIPPPFFWAPYWLLTLNPTSALCTVRERGGSGTSTGPMSRETSASRIFAELLSPEPLAGIFVELLSREPLGGIYAELLSHEPLAGSASFVCPVFIWAGIIANVK